MDDGRLKSKKRPTSSVQHGEMSLPTHRLPHGAGFPGSGLRAGCPGLWVPHLGSQVQPKDTGAVARVWATVDILPLHHQSRRW